MKKMLLILLLVSAVCFLIFLAIDQYTKYALKTATIKFTKEYCNEDITVREVEINRLDLRIHSMWVNKPQWIVRTEPSNYTVVGKIRSGSYIPSGSGCLREVNKIVKLDRIKREFVPW